VRERNQELTRYIRVGAEAVAIAVAHQIAVELNFYLDAIRANEFLICEARRPGVRIILSTDAHHVNALPLMRFASAFVRK